MPAVTSPALTIAGAEQLLVDPLGVVRDFLAEAVPELLARDDLVYRVDDDLAGWCDIISNAPRTDGRNPAFTPGEGPPPDDAYWVEVSHRDGRVAAIAAGRFTFASGFEIVALSSKPRGLRGRQGYVIIDEAAFHDDLPEVLKAAMALLMWGGKVLVISTHRRHRR